MKSSFLSFWLGAIAFPLLSCGGEDNQSAGAGAAEEEQVAAEAPEGPHGGRLLSDGGFAVELSIYETGVPPEYRAWAYQDGQALSPTRVDLSVTLTRLGNELNVIGFDPQGDMLRGDTVIYEPHSFAVEVQARYNGQMHAWAFDSFEGRTTISAQMSQALGVETAIAGPAVLEQRLQLMGHVRPQSGAARRISARFEGLARAVEVDLGDRVEEGDELLTIESNESLNTYTLRAPIGGTITARNVNPGEQTGGRILLEILDPSLVRAELAVYPDQRRQVRTGDPVVLTSPVSDAMVAGLIDAFDTTVGANQAVTARSRFTDEAGDFPPGSFVEAAVKVNEFEVPLAVRRSGLQSFRDFTVVYAKVGNTYEVRMLELGRQDDAWVEVLGGLEPGTEYVTTNSYILKADVEKSGATHDH